MIKKALIVVGVSATYFLQAQDVSTIRNSVEVYGNGAQNGSSKYQAMAGSMGALGGDFSTMNTNPAGIGVNIASDFSATLTIESNKNVSTYAGKTVEYKGNQTDLGNVGGVIAFRLDDSSAWKFVNLGVNYGYQSIDNYAQTAGNSNLVFEISDADGNNIDNLTYQAHAYNRYGYVSKMNVGVGANYDNRLYFGAALNFHSANIEQWDTASFISEKLNSAQSFYKQNTPYSEASTGFSANIGAIAKVNQNFRLGASIETPTWWDIERLYEFYDDSIYGDGSATEDRKLSTPFKATVSAAYVANKNFALNVDYTLGLSKTKYKEFGAGDRELNEFFDDASKNLSELKIGAEYRYGGLRLRGGYATLANPFDNLAIDGISDNGGVSNQSYSDLILGRRNTLAAGIGYDFKSFYIDAAYQNVTSEYSNPFLQGSSAYNAGYFSSMYIVESDAYAVSNVKNTRNNFFLTVGWKF